MGLRQGMDEVSTFYKKLRKILSLEGIPLGIERKQAEKYPTPWPCVKKQRQVTFYKEWLAIVSSYKVRLEDISQLAFIQSLMELPAIFRFLLSF